MRVPFSLVPLTCGRGVFEAKQSSQQVGQGLVEPLHIYMMLRLCTVHVCHAHHVGSAMVMSQRNKVPEQLLIVPETSRPDLCNSSVFVLIFLKFFHELRDQKACVTNLVRVRT